MFARRSENILIIKTDGLAAFVAAEPAYDAIRGAHPHAKISLLTTFGLQRIARASPYFDQVAAMPDFRDAESRKAFVKELKAAKFARVYDLSADENSKRLAASMGAFGPKWLAVEPAPKRRKGEPAHPEFPSLAPLAAAAGFKLPARLPDFRWALAARKDSANMRPTWFGITGQFGLLLPASDEAKRWPASHYARLGQLMLRERVTPVLSGGKELHGFGDEIAHETPEIVDLSGKTDHLQLVALAQEAAFFVSDAAEEIQLALSVGCAGVIIGLSGKEIPAPQGRDVVVVTARGRLDDASPEFVWRTLINMELAPGPKSAARAAAAT